MEKDFGAYELRERIGKGGMAWVYLANQKNLDRPVALKILFPHLAEDATLVERFKLEARSAAAMRHENIAQVYDFGSHGEQFYIAMEYVEGLNLRDWIDRHGAPPLEIALLMLRDICRGLEHAHRRSIIHRDIKPSNVMFTPEGVIKLMDFGLARRVEDRSGITMHGAMLGTPAYMSPEQARGEKLDRPTTDIFSLGIVCYELLGGLRPFQGDSSSVARAILYEEPRPLDALDPLVPPAVEAMIRRMLEKDPSARVQSIGEARHAFDAAVAELGIAHDRELLADYAADPQRVASVLRAKRLAWYLEWLRDAEASHDQMGMLRAHRCVAFLDPSNTTSAEYVRLHDVPAPLRRSPVFPDIEQTVLMSPEERASSRVPGAPVAAPPPASHPGAVSSPPVAPSVPPAGASAPPIAPSIPPIAASIPPVAPSVPPAGASAAPSIPPAAPAPSPAASVPPAGRFAPAAEPSPPPPVAPPAASHPPQAPFTSATPPAAPASVPPASAPSVPPAPSPPLDEAAGGEPVGPAEAKGAGTPPGGAGKRRSATRPPARRPGGVIWVGVGLAVVMIAAVGMWALRPRPAAGPPPGPAPVPSPPPPLVESAPPVGTPLALASMTVAVTPPDASVSLDKGPPQLSPARFTDLQPGSHTVRVMRDSFQTARRVIALGAGLDTTLAIELQRKTAGRVLALHVKVDPADATVVLDGEQTAPAPATFPNVLEGEHTLEVRRAGYATATQAFAVRAQAETTIAIALSRERRSERSVTARSQPRGALIALDDGPPHREPARFDAVAPGPHRVRATLPGYADGVAGFGFGGVRDTTLTLRLEPLAGANTGTIVIWQRPAGNVLIDRVVRYTDVESVAVALPAGREYLIGLQPTWASAFVSEPVRVEAGKSKPFGYDFRSSLGRVDVGLADARQSADILLGGKPTGLRTPNTLYLGSGTHRIDVSLDGLRSREGTQSVKLKGGQQRTLTFTLERR